MTKTGNIFKKAKRNFFLLFFEIQISHIFTQSTQVHHQMQHQMHPICPFVVNLQWLFKVNSKVHLKV